MKNINLYKWLLDLARKEPLLALVAVLLIAVGVLSGVVVNRDRKIDSLQTETRLQAIHYELRIDSITKVKDNQILLVTTEVKQILISNVSDAKAALKEQETLNLRLSTTIIKARTLIKKNRSHLKK